MTDDLPLIKSQIDALRRRGVTPSPNMTRGQLKQLHETARVVQYYINDVWYDHIGSPPDSSTQTSTA